MVGADRNTYERVKPAFKQSAWVVVHLGDPGAGTRMKLPRNMLTFTSLRPLVRRCGSPNLRDLMFKRWAEWCVTPMGAAVVRTPQFSATT